MGSMLATVLKDQRRYYTIDTLKVTRGVWGTRIEPANAEMPTLQHPLGTALTAALSMKTLNHRFGLPSRRRR
jgi:hypothetical protein